MRHVIAMHALCDKTVSVTGGLAAPCVQRASLGPIVRLLPARGPLVERLSSALDQRKFTRTHVGAAVLRAGWSRGAMRADARLTAAAPRSPASAPPACPLARPSITAGLMPGAFTNMFIETLSRTCSRTQGRARARALTRAGLRGAQRAGQGARPVTVA